MVEYETVSLETVRCGGLAWIGLIFLATLLLAFGPIGDYFWLLPVVTLPLAALFVRASYSVRRLWTFALTVYVLGGTGLLLASDYLSTYPYEIVTDTFVNAGVYYGVLLLSGGIAYVLTYRGGYSRVKGAIAR